VPTGFAGLAGGGSGTGLRSPLERVRCPSRQGQSGGLPSAACPQVGFSNRYLQVFSQRFGFTKHDDKGKTVVAMNKAELIEAVQKALGNDASKRQAEDSVNAVLDAIAEGVKKHNKVQIIGFGTFEVKKRAARKGRNPKTGEEMKIAASKTVGFKASSSLKADL
jgi:DNA-binding protein HU-beta